MPKLVIFDCDGVLVDTERLTLQVYAGMLGRLGWHPAEGETLRRFLGRNHQHMADQIESHLGRALPDDWETEYRRLTASAFESGLSAVDGIEEALKRISIPACVASGGSHDRIRTTLSLTGLYPYFEGRIFSAAEVENGKPAPDLFLHAAQQMAAAPADCVVVEDSPAGVEASLSAGMRVLAYSGGVTPASWLTVPGAIVFSEMRSLPILLNTGIDVES